LEINGKDSALARGACAILHHFALPEYVDLIVQHNGVALITKVMSDYAVDNVDNVFV
jgi:hypothetical protein